MLTGKSRSHATILIYLMSIERPHIVCLPPSLDSSLISIDLGDHVLKLMLTTMKEASIVRSTTTGNGWVHLKDYLTLESFQPRAVERLWI